MSQPSTPKGVAVFDRPPPRKLSPTLLIAGLSALALAMGAGLHYFHYL